VHFTEEKKVEKFRKFSDFKISFVVDEKTKMRKNNDENVKQHGKQNNPKIKIA
jgi:hypothetical protein